MATPTAPSPESRGPHLVENPAASKNLTHKKWYGVALAVGILVVIGVAGFGITGLLQANGVTLPPALHWLSVATQYVGNVVPLNGCLWIMSVGGTIIGGIIITLSSSAIYRINQNKVKTREPSLNAPQNSQQIRELSLNITQNVVKGTVYIESLESGPIRNDQLFKFSQRLKNREGRPIVIKEDDIYLKLGGEISEVGFLSDTPFHFLTHDGSKLSSTYLPASLFEGVKEGETIQFIWDDKLVELTCSQNVHPLLTVQNTTFENMLSEVKEYSLLNQTPCLFSIDLTRGVSPVETPKGREITIRDFLQEVEPISDDQPRFMGQLLGQKHVKLNEIDETGVPVKISDFSSYEEDQTVNGEYRVLEAFPYGKNQFKLKVHRDRVALSEIDLIESTGIGGVRQIWVMIPHQPHKNKIEAPLFEIQNGKLKHTGTHTVTPEQLIEHEHIKHLGFNLKESYITTTTKKGQIKYLSTYYYGQYCMVPIGKNIQPSLYFDADGYLVLNLTPV